jgi:hypothetical protein
VTVPVKVILVFPISTTDNDRIQSISIIFFHFFAEGRARRAASPWRSFIGFLARGVGIEPLDGEQAEAANCFTQFAQT